MKQLPATKNQCGYLRPGQGQCPMESVEGGDRCPKHGGGAQLASQKKSRVRAYHLNQWRTSIADNSNDPEIKNLRDEVGILRMTLNAVLNRCKDNHDLLMMSGQVQSLVNSLQVLMKTVHTIDKDEQSYITEEQLAAWMSQVFDILTEEIQDEELIGNIVMKLSEVEHVS